MTLTYAQVEALLGVPLPKSAWVRSFRGNSGVPWGGTSQAWAWRSAGWRVGAVAPGLWATFARRSATVA